MEQESLLNNEFIFSIIDKYFNDNPNALVSHHHDSYNAFFNHGLKQIFKEKNPITILKQQDEQTKEFNLECKLYLGGKEGDKIYYGKPIIYDDRRSHFMFPNEARLRNMTYGFSIHYDVDVEFKIITDTEIVKSITLDKIFLGRFPIMLQSNLCILENLEPKARFEAGECVNDPGGYFVIDGKEKVIICQEKFGDNMLYVRDKYSDIYHYSVEIKSASEDASKPIRTTAIRMVTPTSTSTNNNLVVVIPNVRKPIPLFIVMRALGVISDKEIIEYCLLDLKKNEQFIDLFIPCVHDAGKIFTQTTAIKYIATFTKGKTTAHVLDILGNLFLPHIGELNFKNKALFLGHMALKLLKVFIGEEKVTDRDNFKFKRVELSGSLLHGLFKEYYSIMQRNVFQKIDKEYYYHEGQYQGMQFMNLIENNYKEFFKERYVEAGFRKAFKGNWGAEAHTKRPGVVQDLNRLSFNSALAQRRKINLPLDASAKVIGPRLLHSSQWGIIDPLDTPDGGNVGLHKHMTIAAKISTGNSREKYVEFVKTHEHIELIDDATLEDLSKSTKIFINGSWIAITDKPQEVSKWLVFNRRIGILPFDTSISWNISHGHIEIYSDAGRLNRPIFYINENRIPGCLEKFAYDKITKNEFTWRDVTQGFNKPLPLFSQYKGSGQSEASLREKQAVIEFIDSSEEETAYISSENQDFTNNLYTHVDIHPSLLLGVMGNQIIYPENNQLPRNLFSCGQSKQAASWYHTNFQNRIDKMGLVLNYGQIPLVKSRYLHYINKETQPYGENPIVAIMCYGGYNVEDSILFNKGSIDRGMFRTTYYNSYETREESSKVSGSLVDSKFTNIEAENVIGLKPGVDYSYLDQYGMIKENTFLNDKIALIGKANINLEDPNTKIDSSVYPKKGQLGFVDKSFMTEGDEGFRLAKVRIREERIPAIGDKFCSRCGQKGTVGLVIPEENMPFTQNGIKPDIIINPHAFPSRMTIGQLVEVLTAKAGVYYGAFGDCTAFFNKGPKNEVYGRLLSEVGYNKKGNEILYDGETGEQLEAEIFIGPTYYMRLKHMVKDKINYRAQGPRTLLTRQTVQGRANDGGLRIGEMERDGVIAHGAAKFLQDSMMNRGDQYYMAVCNNSGTIAVYNESQNLFLSPMTDGPIKFNGEIDEKLSVINISRYGRDFSVLHVPYSFKLLMQELGTMNIQMRVVTDKNVDQLTSMSYSDNINILLNNKDITPKEIHQQSMKRREKTGYNPKLQIKRDIAEKKLPFKPVAFVKAGEAPLENTPMFVGEVEYNEGDDVNYSLDIDPDRIWRIIHVDRVTGDYKLQTSNLNNLPPNALYSDDNTKATVLAKKLQIYRAFSPPGSPAAVYDPYGLPDYHPPSSGSPDYRPPSSGSPDYRPPSSGTPDYRPPSSGTPDYRPPSSGTPDYRPPSSPGYQPASPSEGEQYLPPISGYNPDTPEYDKGSPSLVRSSSSSDISRYMPGYVPPRFPNDPERISTPLVTPEYNPNTPSPGNVVFKSALSSDSPSYAPPSSDDPYWETFKKPESDEKQSGGAGGSLLAVDLSKISPDGGGDENKEGGTKIIKLN